MARYEIRSKSEGGHTEQATRTTRESAILEARRQLFHPSSPSFVRIEKLPVDRKRKDMV